MTSPTPSAPSFPNGGYVSNEVIALQLKHMGDTMDALRGQVVGELQMLRAESVRRDLYDQQRQSDKDALDGVYKELNLALAPIKDELKEARQKKWAVWLAVGVAVLALTKDLLGAILKVGMV